MRLPRRRSAFSCRVFVFWLRARVSPCVLDGGRERGCSRVSAFAVWRTGWRVSLVCRVFGFRVGVCYGVGVAAIFVW